MKTIIYTQNSCASCKMVKGFLNHKGVDYEEVNLDEEPDRREEAIELSGTMMVPVTIINGIIVSGYNPIRLREAIKKAEYEG